MREIKLFGKALKVDNMSFSDVNSLANSKGYLVHPSCCNSRVYDFLVSLPINYNSTFYKTWQDVTSKDRAELFVDQCKHYASTYGTNFEGKPFIVNKTPNLVDFTDYKVILPITEEEIAEKVIGMLNSGIALKQETIEDLIYLITEFNITIDIDKVKNKEALMFLFLKLKLIPTKAEEAVRFLVFLHTEKTLLIKDRMTINVIKSKKINITDYVNKFGIEKLASVFHRFKPLFLAMKSNKENAKVINKLRKLAEKYHKPYEFGYFETLLSGKSDLSKLKENLEFVSNYKKVALLQAIRIREKETGIMPILVRNQKLFVKNIGLNYKEFYTVVYEMIYESLVESISKKACNIKLHPSIKLALPTSEKSFIGSVPFGSYVEMGTENSVVGINWKGVDGANDLDLSLIDSNFNKIGWNSDFYDDKDDAKVIYSGDITSANPEATELLYCKKTIPNSVVNVNLYSGDEKSKFTLFFAKTDNEFKPTRNVMVNPNDILFSTQLEMSSREMLCGIISDGKFQFANIRTGNKLVSSAGSVTSTFIDYCGKIQTCYLDLECLLVDAGFKIVDKNPDIDLSTADKSTLINLLSK